MWHLPADQNCPLKVAFDDLRESKPAMANCCLWLFWMWWQSLPDRSWPLLRLYRDETNEVSILSHFWLISSRKSMLSMDPCDLISDNGPNYVSVEFSDFRWLGHPTCHIQSPSPTGKWPDDEVHYQQSQHKKSRCMESYSRMGKLTYPISRQFPSPTPYVT